MIVSLASFVEIGLTEPEAAKMNKWRTKVMSRYPLQVMVRAKSAKLKLKRKTKVEVILDGSNTQSHACTHSPFGFHDKGPC